ncbi:uncharacterized protein LOC120711759 [Panicum virgatum]|uniref:MBD domain-containing protein n=3 Tax=Panicum virgatum TaxID=38727 RepID=A0A8T0R973_PANVG|nr:uncharacterized protein LOC120711759 [Panicum virgatum]XP_039853330.1 uncharacterized protein LOC120711759 [Panicum virgatum]KAG2582353.1 hypothetical protein PVAP13_6KG104500 [Panicum virgatum]KAG2582357.1 hypothetical protein PVAP13_6KG104500 [Panicum virgatum]
MQSDWQSCPRIQSRVVRVNCVMDSGNSSCSRTRSGLVRRKGIFAPSKASCSRTRSGLVRIKSFVHSRDGSSSRTRSGLIRIKSFVDSSDSSCSRTRSDPVSGSPQVVEDEEVLKGSSDGWVKEDSPMRTRNVKGSPAAKAVITDEPATKGLSDGCLNDEMPSRTRSGLVRRRPTFKGEDMLDGTQSGLIRGSPASKILSKNQPVIKGLADGLLKEDTPPGTRSGLVRGSLASKPPVEAELVTMAQHDGWLEKDKPAGTQSDLVGGRPAPKTLRKNGRVIEGLPDGWRKEYRPRKIGSFQDPFYIDPISGYEFRSLKDVHRYLETGDIDQCAMKPKKGSTIYDIHITESQNLTSSSSQHTKPSTADKGIQCEILTSEGIMMPWEDLVTPYSENDTEDTVLPESESLKAMQGYVDKLETLEHMRIEPVSAQCGTTETKPLKRKERNVEVRSKKRKTNPAVTAIRVSPRLAALNVQQKAIIEPEDQPINVNLINRVHSIEENSNDQSQMNQSGTVNQIHRNLESTSVQLQLSQADTAEGMEGIQETTTNHSQLSQVDAVNHIQTNQDKTANQVDSILADISVVDRSIIDHADIPIQTMQGCTKDPLSQAAIVNHIQTDQDFTANQLQLSLADSVIPVQPFQEYTFSYSQPGTADTVNQIQANQESTCDHFHLSQVDTATKMQIIQENLTRQPNLSQADNVGQAHIDLESTIDYSQLSKADTINQLQVNQENTADQLHFSQVDRVTQIQLIQGNMSKHPQLSQDDTMDRIHINLESTTNHLQPNYAENSMLQASFSWAPEQNGGVDFWKNFENQDSLVPMPVEGATVESFPANVRFQSAAGTEEPALPAQSSAPETGSDQSGLPFQSLFGNAWSDPCIEFAFKTLTGDIPVLDDTRAVTECFPEQQDLNKDPSLNCSASVLDNTKNHTQVDVNLPAPMPSDNLYNGSWFPPP